LRSPVAALAALLLLVPPALAQQGIEARLEGCAREIGYQATGDGPPGPFLALIAEEPTAQPRRIELRMDATLREPRLVASAGTADGLASATFAVPDSMFSAVLAWSEGPGAMGIRARVAPGEGPRAELSVYRLTATSCAAPSGAP
jgi:hypothetical protein